YALVAVCGRGRRVRGSLLQAAPLGPGTRHLRGRRRRRLRTVGRLAARAGGEGAAVRLDAWPLGLGICYDGCFPEHARAAADDGALVYVCPSAYVVGSEHRRDLYYAARAIDNGVYVVFAGLVGRCGALEFSGGTAIYDPQGRAVA